ncbi:MAG TPA: AAA family ATPase, partial [Abditibacteriaceae bacterium]|nr:AAA family ATPase [Abditibacteriaceae bacterium]
MTVISQPVACWHLECFGSLRACRPDHVIERFRTQKTASLLAILAIQGAQPREKLCDLLWPEASPEAARNSLSAALSALRREFGDDHICADRFRVSLALGAFSTDVALFDEALRDENLATATSLYRDHLLPGSYEESLLALAREYEEKACIAFETHLQQLEASGSYAEAVTTARRALSLFPGTSTWFLVLMRAHHAMQQYDAALEVFKDLSNFARRENDLVPDAARHLARQIRRDRENHNPLPRLSAPTLESQSSTRNTEIPQNARDSKTTPADSVPEIAANLPLTWTPFFGREDEIDQLQALLCHERFITLTGMGGTGKTRLVIQLARRVASEWNNRIYFVPLAALLDDELLFSTIRDALQLPSAPDLPPLQQIVAALAGAPAILLLDNFEQLVKGGAARLQQLRAALPHITFVVTSRVLLNLPSECEWAVPTLPTPGADSDYEECASTALFINRAQ